MEVSDAVWGGLLLAGTAFEVYALRNGKEGDTLSETTRRVFRVKTRAGKIVFVGTWAAFAAWYLWHIAF